MQFKKDVVRIIIERKDIEIIEQFTDLINSICGGTELKYQDTAYCSKCPLTHMCTTNDVLNTLRQVPNTVIEVKESSR